MGRDLSCILFCMPYIIKTSLKTCAVSEGLRSTLSVPNLHGPDPSTYMDIALIFEAPPPQHVQSFIIPSLLIAEHFTDLFTNVAKVAVSNMGKIQDEKFLPMSVNFIICSH